MNKQCTIAILLLSFLLIKFDLCAHPIPPAKSLEEIQINTDMDKLLILLQKRLLVMHEVARIKWNQDLPIEDKAREESALADLTRQGSLMGLSPELIVPFFQAQFNAAKEIIKSDFNFWSKTNLGKMDLILKLGDLRSYIDNLNNEILTLLVKIKAQQHPNIAECISDQPLLKRNVDYVEDSIWLISIAPLKKILQN